ncbi:hypothetical protein Hanom_Chr16g01507061 [Helianthus anomalus]
MGGKEQGRQLCGTQWLAEERRRRCRQTRGYARPLQWRYLVRWWIEHRFDI